MTSLALTHFGRRPRELDAPDGGHRHEEGLTGHRERHLEAAGADCEHPEAPGSGRMTVRAEEGHAGLAEAFLVDGVADAVARAAEPDAESPAGALEEEVIVGVPEVLLDEVVIDVLRGELGSYALEAHGFELQHHERPGRVLRERLIDANAYLFASSHASRGEVRCDQLLGDVHSHGCCVLARGSAKRSARHAPDRRGRRRRSIGVRLSHALAAGTPRRDGATRSVRLRGARFRC